MDLALLFCFLQFVLLLLHSVETPESPVSSSVDLGVLSLLAFCCCCCCCKNHDGFFCVLVFVAAAAAVGIAVSSTS